MSSAMARCTYSKPLLVNRPVQDAQDERDVELIGVRSAPPTPARTPMVSLKSAAMPLMSLELSADIDVLRPVVPAGRLRASVSQVEREVANVAADIQHAQSVDLVTEVTADRFAPIV